MSDVTVIVKQTLEHKELIAGLSAFRVTREVTLPEDAPLWSKSLIASETKVGIAATEKVIAFEKGQAGYLHNDSGFELCPAELLTIAQEKGFIAATDENSSSLVWQQRKAANADPLNPPEGYKLVKVDYYSNMLFDVFGWPLPIAISFDYLNGMVDNVNYDLKRLVPFLQTNPQIRPIVEKGYTEGTIKIDNIPYYNCTEGRAKFVKFWFCPTAEQMVSLWDMAKSLNAKYPSTELRRAVFELDLIGLRKEGIALKQGYYD